jgi:hypothetical protein
LLTAPKTKNASKAKSPATAKRSFVFWFSGVILFRSSEELGFELIHVLTPRTWHICKAGVLNFALYVEPKLFLGSASFVSRMPYQQRWIQKTHQQRRMYASG